MPVSAQEVLDVSFYQPQLEVLQQDPNTRIVGSIGRMVACQEVVGRPFQEFEDRRTNGYMTDRVSDIDVLGTSPEVLAAAREAGEAYVDDLAFRDTDVTIENDGGTWFLRSPISDFEAPIDPALMEPVVGEISGVVIVTVPLLTHRALHMLRNSEARKDWITDHTIGFLVHTMARSGGAIPRLDAQQARPFQQLQSRLRMHSYQTTSTRHSAEEDDERHSF